MEKTKLKLISDNPLLHIQDKDGLNFKMYSQVISSAILGTPGPFTIGIYGDWGTGKTSLMKLTKKEIEEDNNIVSVWFNAWQYEQEEHPLVPLIATIIDEIEKNETFLKTLEDEGKKLINSLRALAYGFSAKTKIKVPGFSEVEASFIAKDMIDREEKLNSDPLLDKTLYYGAFESLNTAATLTGDKKIVVFIDDLDRCFPDKAIKLLESIKLVLSQSGFVFVLGVAKKIVEDYLTHRYDNKYGIKDFDGASYLDKIVQLPFVIPSHKSRITKFAETLLEKIDRDKDDKLKPIIEVVSHSYKDNPRSIIRFVNNILIDEQIYKKTKETNGDEYIGYFAISRCLEQKWQDIYSYILHKNTLCEKLYKLSQKDSIIEEDHKEFKGFEEFILNKLKSEEELKKLFENEYGKLWCTNHELRLSTSQFLEDQKNEEDEKSKKSDNFIQYIKEKNEKQLRENENNFKNKFVKVGDITISKYLVTNSWYKEYLDDTDTQKPEYWQDKDFNAPNQPVVGINIKEAKAFCKWLSKNDPKYTYELPTEDQWQKIAEGTKKRAYPWGDEWDETKCNNDNLNIDKPTAVGIFEDGNTPEGISDMAGNVWEWTDSLYDEKDKDYYVIRGGSWLVDDSSDFRCGFRYYIHARGRINVVGFRCTRI